MAYFQDLLNFKYNLTGEQVNVGNLLREKKKGKCPSVNLQMKPFSIRPLHLICSQKERVTPPPHCTCREQGLFPVI